MRGFTSSNRKRGNSAPRGTGAGLFVQVEVASEAALHGPHAFPLERLLSIFWHLMRAESDHKFSASEEQSSDIFGQIASLTCLRLLVQASSPPRSCMLASCRGKQEKSKVDQASAHAFIGRICTWPDAGPATAPGCIALPRWGNATRQVRTLEGTLASACI